MLLRCQTNKTLISLDVSGNVHDRQRGNDDRLMSDSSDDDNSDDDNSDDENKAQQERPGDAFARAFAEALKVRATHTFSALAPATPGNHAHVCVFRLYF